MNTIEILDKLISFDTVSRNSNMALVDFASDFLKSCGSDLHLVKNDTGDKASIYATLGPLDRGGLLFSGHTDVVPVDGQDWTNDPFKMVQRDGRLFGRGTCDMKGFVAAALAQAHRLKDQTLKTPVHFALSYDEEVGCLGVRPLTKAIADRFPLPAMAIVGEPTEMNIVSGHKSGYRFITTVTGVEGHSSRPQDGVNAIQYAASLIGYLDQLQSEYLDDTKLNTAFSPPYSTLHVGTITGGTALNIIPGECEFVWEFRGVPELAEEEVPQKMNAYAQTLMDAFDTGPGPKGGLTIATRNSGGSPVFAPRKNSRTIDVVSGFLNDAKIQTEAYGTEAGFFQGMEIDTVVCGPGSLAQAHKPDEFLSLDQLTQCDQLLTHMTETLN